WVVRSDILTPVLTATLTDPARGPRFRPSRADRGPQSAGGDRIRGGGPTVPWRLNSGRVAAGPGVPGTPGPGPRSGRRPTLARGPLGPAVAVDPGPWAAYMGGRRSTATPIPPRLVDGRRPGGARRPPPRLSRPRPGARSRNRTPRPPG